jgi:hypothetical protein
VSSEEERVREIVVGSPVASGSGGPGRRGELLVCGALTGCPTWLHRAGAAVLQQLTPQLPCVVQPCDELLQHCHDCTCHLLLVTLPITVIT